MPNPAPLTDLAKILKDQNLPPTEENINKIADMLSMTFGERMLAMMLVKS